MKINNGELVDKLRAFGYKVVEPLLEDTKLSNALDADDNEVQNAQLKGATLADALSGNGKNATNLGRIEIGEVASGTTKPSTQDTFEIQIDTSTGTNGEAYIVWNDGGTKRTISIGTT